MRIGVALACLLLIGLPSFAQNWKQVHKKDEERWAKTTGLDVYTIHKLWRAASNAPDESSDDSRIADIDLTGLAVRHELMLVTYAGENNCLTITVFRQLSDVKYDKVWSIDKPPDGSGFCDSPLGTAKAVAENGAIAVRVPRSSPTKDGAIYTLYMYQWNGVTYRMVDEKDVQ